MNTATKNLEDDHVHILHLIEVMERVIGSENPDISHLESIVDIIRNFADGLHHAKEENQFFPFLANTRIFHIPGSCGSNGYMNISGQRFCEGDCRKYLFV